MKRLAAVAMSSTFLLCAPPVAHAQPREEVIREWQCNVQERVYVQTQGTPRVLGGQCNTTPHPHPQTCSEVKTTYMDGRWSTDIRCRPAN